VAAASARVHGFTRPDWTQPLRHARPGACTTTLSAHLTDNGVWFDSRGWLIAGSNR